MPYLPTNPRTCVFETPTQKHCNERIGQLTPSKQRFNIPWIYRSVTSKYDPSKSILFSVDDQVREINWSFINY